MARFDFGRLARAAFLAGLGGFVNFLIQEPYWFTQEMSAHRRAGLSVLATMAVSDAILGALVTIGLILAEEIGALSIKRMVVRLPVALIAGAACGAVAGVVGQSIYSALLPASRVSPSDLLSLLPTIILARTLGWAFSGAGIGLAGGLAFGSPRKCVQGLVGGLAGGGAGGMLFDVIGMLVGGGTASRFVGDIAIGAFVGASVMLVQEISKVAWITRVAGRNEGRQFILSKGITTIGRDELADIPLFGDPAVARAHATIQAADRRQFVLLDSGSSAGTVVNGQRVAQHPLSDGDVIQIGAFQLVFGHRDRATVPIPSAASNQPGPTPGFADRSAYPSSNPALCPFCGQTRDPITGTCACTPPETAKPVAIASPANLSRPSATLTGLSGPYAKATFTINTDRALIGRAPSNTIVLDRDTTVSRSHATISLENGVFVLRDNGSSNGTYLNGARVQQAVLNPGDQIHAGATTFIFQ